MDAHFMVENARYLLTICTEGDHRYLVRCSVDGMRSRVEIVSDEYFGADDPEEMLKFYFDRYDGLTPRGQLPVEESKEAGHGGDS